MTWDVEYVSNHLFVGGYRGKLCSNNYFRCKVKNCPFSLLMGVETVNWQKVATCCRSVVIPVHDHEKGKCKTLKKREILRDLKYIHDHPNDPRSLALKKDHMKWNREARRSSKAYKRHAIEIEAVKVYALEHPGISATQIMKECAPSLNERSIANMILLEKEKRGLTTNIADMVRQKSHHVLGNDGEDIVVFGLESAIQFLSNTTLIQGDGTFTWS